MSFSVYLDSTHGTRVVSTTNNSIDYTFDFSVIPPHNGKYKLSYSFLTQGGVTLLGTDNMLIKHNLPVSLSSYQGGAVNTNGSAPTSVLGMARIVRLSGADNFWEMPHTHSVPLILNSIPNGRQTFNISLYNSGTGVLDAKILLTSYDLVLFFDAI